ncbi:MAG: ferredoxin--NADP reductase [Pseudomonadales bacterium]
MAATIASTADIASLRQSHYNAVVTSVTKVHDDLMILRAKPDVQPLKFYPGQYTVLGLGNWEPRAPGSQMEDISAIQEPQLIKRAYSISSRLLDDHDDLIRTSAEPELEFFVAIIRQAAEPPALTPRLFLLEPGNRIYVGPRAHGRYTLRGISPDDQIVFAATGTGEAPHNAMIAELLATQHKGLIINSVCVRHRHDLAYLVQHRILEQRYVNYCYFPLTTREPENLDDSRPDFVGKRYLQDMINSADLTEMSGYRSKPENTHFFLCGNPEMIGVPHHTHDLTRRYPRPVGMVEVLERQGFHVDLPHEPGNIHFETYW